MNNIRIALKNDLPDLRLNAVGTEQEAQLDELYEHVVAVLSNPDSKWLRLKGVVSDSMIEISQIAVITASTREI